MKNFGKTLLNIIRYALTVFLIVFVIVFGIVGISEIFSAETFNIVAFIVFVILTAGCVMGAIALKPKRTPKSALLDSSCPDPSSAAKSSGWCKKFVNAMTYSGTVRKVKAKHACGLPIAEGLTCTILSYSDRLDITSGTTHITLNKSKITDMCVKKETDIQKQYVSSAGGAVGGALLFGAAGALIGGMAHKKTIRSTSNYLIITYKKETGSISYLAFRVGMATLSATMLAQEFHRDHPNAGVNLEL